MTAAPAEATSLRERKKRRTRDTLVRTAFALFHERGYVGTTLDELCDAAEVSRRTFFRYFRGKEDVVLEPGHEMWTDLVEDLTSRDLHDGPVLSVLGAGVVDVVRARTGDEWSEQLRQSRLLAAANPGVDAAGLWWCDRVCDTLAETLHRRGGFGVDDPRPRMCVDLVVHATNDVLRRWAAEPVEPGADVLAEMLRERFAVLPELTGFRAGAR